VLDLTFGFLNRGFGVWNQWNESRNYFPHTYALCAGCGRDVTLEEMVRSGGGIVGRPWDVKEAEEESVAGGVGRAKMIDAVLAGVFMDTLKGEGVGPAKALQVLFRMLNAERGGGEAAAKEGQETTIIHNREIFTLPLHTSSDIVLSLTSSSILA
jgi:hypothetical protein